jgi:hypothetical protein
MPSAFAQRVIEETGPVDGYLLIDPVFVETATTEKAGKLGAVSRYEPWTHEKTKLMLETHPVAIWREFKVTISSRAGVFGRMCTFYGGWARADALAPTTVTGVLNLRGSVMKTVGGTGDPGMWSTTIGAPFTDGMADVLQVPYNQGVRPVFYYCFVETELTDKAPKADRFCLNFYGHFDVYGRY